MTKKEFFFFQFYNYCHNRILRVWRAWRCATKTPKTGGQWPDGTWLVICLPMARKQFILDIIAVEVSFRCRRRKYTRKSLLCCRCHKYFFFAQASQYGSLFLQHMLLDLDFRLGYYTVTFPKDFCGVKTNQLNNLLFQFRIYSWTFYSVNLFFIHWFLVFLIPLDNFGLGELKKLYFILVAIVSLHSIIFT